MGLLGAMAGAGKGLTDYADTLKEKEKRDWEARQEQVKHERAMNLQALADANASKRDEARFKAEEGLLKTQQTLENENVIVGEIDGVPVRASEVDKLSDPRFKKTRDVALQFEKDKALGANEVEDRIAREKWDELQGSEEYAKAPEGLKTLMKLQYAVSRDVDVSKLLGALGSSGGGGGKGSEKAPPAAMVDSMMIEMEKDPTFAKLLPAQKLAVAGKMAYDLVNTGEIKHGGKVVQPENYAEVAKEFAEGKRDWSSITQLSSESVIGIMGEFEKIRPSTNLDARANPISRYSGVPGGADEAPSGATTGLTTERLKGVGTGLLGRLREGIQERRDSYAN